MPPRTVNYATNRLKALGLIQEEKHGDDAREKVYVLVSAPV